MHYVRASVVDSTCGAFDPPRQVTKQCDIVDNFLRNLFDITNETIIVFSVPPLLLVKVKISDDSKFCPPIFPAIQYILFSLPYQVWGEPQQ